MPTWTDLLPEASGQRTLARAAGAAGRSTVYKLGKGGFDPSAALGRECDCSGFVAWAIGIPRELPPRSGRWLSTDQYWAGGRGVVDGLCVEVPKDQAQPGDLYVYPDYVGQDGRKREGHIGIVTQVAGGKPTRVVHCSYGNYRNHGDGIRETEPTVFERNAKARVMRVDYDVLRRRFAPAPAAALRHRLLRDDATLREVAAGRRVLKQTGGQVPGIAAVQDALNLLAATRPAYRVDLGANRQYSGYFGQKTAAAIRAFQGDQGLGVDGQVGRNTIQKLDDALMRFDQMTPPPHPPAPVG